MDVECGWMWSVGGCGVWVDIGWMWSVGGHRVDVEEVSEQTQQGTYICMGSQLVWG